MPVSPQPLHSCRPRPCHILARFYPLSGEIPAKNSSLKKKGGTRNTFLFDSNKVVFSSNPSNQQASYKEDSCLLVEALTVQLCLLRVVKKTR